MLITAAPLCTAFAIASPEALQVAVPSLIGIGTLSTRAPGHTPTIPRPFCGAAATAAVAVPCGLVTGVFPSTLMFGSPRNSSWVRSAAASTSAISGLSGTTGGGVRSGRRPSSASRPAPTADRSAIAVVCAERVRLGVDEQPRPSALAKARARERATS